MSTITAWDKDFYEIHEDDYITDSDRESAEIKEFTLDFWTLSDGVGSVKAWAKTEKEAKEWAWERGWEIGIAQFK